MSLAQKTLAIISLTIVGLMVVLYATTRVLILKSFLSLEETDTRAAVERAENALNDDISNLASTANDYAAWDRTYAFMVDRSPDYIRKEFEADTLQGLAVNSVLLVDSKGQIVFYKAFDSLGKIDSASSIADQVAFASDPWVRQADRALSPASGILILPLGPVLVAAYPILTTRRQGPARGVLMMTRNMDAARLDRLMVVTGSSLSLSPYIPTQNIEPKTPAGAPQPIEIQPLNADLVAGYAVLNDVHEKPVLLLGLTARRTIFQHGLSSLRYFLGAYGIAGGVFGLTTLLLLRLAVLDRLARLSAAVTGIGRRKDPSERVDVSGNDELSNLGGAINATLEALQQTEDQLRQIAENIHQVFWVRDVASRKFTYVSQAYEKIWGRARDGSGLSSEDWWNSIYAEDSAVVAAMLEQQWQGRSGAAEYRIVRPDGAIRWIGDRYFPVLDRQRKLIQIAGLGEDITELKKAQQVLLRSQEELEDLVRQRTVELAEANETLRAEINEREQAQQALQSSEERSRQLFATIPIAVWLYSESTHKFLEVNDAAVQHYGYSREEFLRMTIEEIRPAGELDRLRKDLTAARPDKSISGWKHRKKDGTLIDVEIRSHRIRLAGVSMILVAAQDVTDRNLMEMELRHSQKLRAVGELAAGIAHEINTPIQFVGDNVRFLQDSFGDLLNLLEKHEQLCQVAAGAIGQNKLLEEIKAAREKADLTFLRQEIPSAVAQTIEGVGRVAKIVQALKRFAHVDWTHEKATADLNQALESTLIVARSELKYVADVETAFSTLPPVMCHLEDLNQVFLNLLINAAHAIGDVVQQTGKKGRIRVETRADSQWADIFIADTGAGIPEEIRNRIFEPFFTTKPTGKGSGQGLALARAIVVEKHGGSLTFESEVGKGTTFRIRIPLNPTVPEGAEATA